MHVDAFMNHFYTKNVTTAMATWPAEISLTYMYMYIAFPPVDTLRIHNNYIQK